jgi:hypothetical protein
LWRTQLLRRTLLVEALECDCIVPISSSLVVTFRAVPYSGKAFKWESIQRLGGVGSSTLT